VVDGRGGTVHNAGVRRRPRAAVRSSLLLVVGLAVSACSDEPDATPATSTRPSEVTTSLAPADPAETAVVEAYEASWVAFGAFVNGDAPGEPSDYFEGDHLATVVDRIAQYADDGLELRGEADLAPSEVAIVGAAASLVDCQIDGTYAVERSSGDVVIPATARPQEVIVELVLVDSRWKVSSVDYGAEGSCER
jgi:hypothetical protein